MPTPAGFLWIGVRDICLRLSTQLNARHPSPPFRMVTIKEGMTKRRCDRSSRSTCPDRHIQSMSPSTSTAHPPRHLHAEAFRLPSDPPYCGTFSSVRISGVSGFPAPHRRGPYCRYPRGQMATRPTSAQSNALSVIPAVWGVEGAACGLGVGSSKTETRCQSHVKMQGKLDQIWRQVRTPSDH
jgi:hypothetical protein